MKRTVLFDQKELVPLQYKMLDSKWLLYEPPTVLPPISFFLSKKGMEGVIKNIVYDGGIY